MSNQNKKISDMDERDLDSYKRFDFNHAPPKQPIKCNMNINDVLVNPKKTAMQHAMGDDFDKKQNSTNSNSPISVTSLDEIFDSGEPKNGNLHQKTSFYSAHHNFSDDKSSGASSLFSSGM